MFRAAYWTETVRVMRTTFDTELGELITDLANMIRLTGQMMTNAAIALHQADLVLAGVVIAKCDQMTASLDNMEQRCVVLLARQAAVAADLRAVVAAVHVLSHVKRMADLARHIAIVPRLKHPNPMISSPVRPVLARMSLLASQLAEDAATTIEYRDPLSGDRLAEADEEVDTLRRHLFGILFADDWSHGVEPAVDAALISRYYERFADYAVAIARQVGCLAIDGIAEPDTLGRRSAASPSPPDEPDESVAG